MSASAVTSKASVSAGLRKMVQAKSQDGGLEDATNIMSVSELAKAMTDAAAGKVLGELHVDIDSQGGGEDLFSVAGGDAELSVDLSIEEVMMAIGGESENFESVTTALGFPEEAIAKGPVALRDRLLMSSLPDIFGLTIDSPLESVSKVYLMRSSQVNRAFPPSKTSAGEERLAVSDILNILLSTNDHLSDEEKRAAYKAAVNSKGELFSFQNHVSFSFATEGADVVVNLAVSKASSSMTSVNSASRKARTSSRTMSKRDQKAVDRKKKERLKRKAQFAGAAWREAGDPFKGALVFGVGENARGFKHVLSVYALGFLIVFMLTFVGIIGKLELVLLPNDPSVYIRSGVLAALGILGILALRRENILRIGLAPKVLGTVLSLPIALMVGLIASAIARFDIVDGNTYQMAVPLILARAAGESIFFHGFLTRTMLIEFKGPAPALLLSTFMYGLFALTYPALANLSPGNIVYAVFIYGAGMGLSMGFVYWRTRSVIVVMICQFIIYSFSVSGGIDYAARIAAG
jgi:membrane protease YdiL (CAAX protease family)